LQVFRKLKEKRKKEAENRKGVVAESKYPLRQYSTYLMIFSFESDSKKRSTRPVAPTTSSPVKEKDSEVDSPFRIYKKGSIEKITETSSEEMKNKLMNSDALYQLSSDDEVDELESNLDR
jgi:hypothetical protein